ncbi:MAG: hypothetical protein NTV22_19585 [bacterium]|nr:hypothetical protein [bacterium]
MKFQGYSGMLLKSRVAQAFVIADPYPRVLSFSTARCPSPFYIAPMEYLALRAWFMEPRQTRASGVPAALPGRVIIHEPRRVRIEGTPEPRTRLQLILDVTLDATAPIMRVTHGFKNIAATSRTLAAWAIACVPLTGRFVVPWGPGKNPFRSITYWHITNPAEPCFQFGRRAFGMDLDPAPLSTGALKVGIHTTCGWGACVYDKTACIMTAPFIPGGDYPEGGGTITMYKTTPPDKAGWAELERVGPLTVVPPGATVLLNEEYRLLPLPARPPKDPDALCALLNRKRCTEMPI